VNIVEQLARVGREAVERGLVVGSGGNLSAREPGADEILVTVAGAWLDNLDARSFVRVGLRAGASSTRFGPNNVDSKSAGAIRPGSIGPTSELGLHLAAYRARPEINAVIHLHPQATVLLDALGERIRLITTDHAYYVRRVATTPVQRPGTAAVGQAAAQALADGTNCLILPHHGCCVVGRDVDEAWRRATNLEEAARLTYRALLLAGGLPGRAIVECPIEFGPVDTV
jgi:ribulose-5-phosphate 4-epimerase/fuculose-1-phosphate aldolase